MGCIESVLPPNFNRHKVKDILDPFVEKCKDNNISFEKLRNNKKFFVLARKLYDINYACFILDYHGYTTYMDNIRDGHFVAPKASQINASFDEMLNIINEMPSSRSVKFVYFFIDNDPFQKIINDELEDEKEIHRIKYNSIFN